ncbi:MAG: CotH kinase family protein, partial [Muribaculaceae bacterium]|nr:CotH kinase family protein [Muribaculaceae bacterium]
MNKISLLLVVFTLLSTGRGLSAKLTGINQEGRSEVLTTTLAHGFPVIVITTEDGRIPTVDIVSPPEGAIGLGTSNATKVPGCVERYEVDGTCSFSSGDYVKKESGMTIKIRGNSSAQWSRKPYKIKLQKKADLLNRGDKNLVDKNWALLTSGAWRNWMAMTLSRKISRQWTPDCEWVNVIFNGTYHGLYLLAETIERNTTARINVAEDGFIVEKDPYWWTEDGEYIPSVLFPLYGYTFKYPEFSDLNEDEKEYIKTTLDPLLEKLEWSG